MSTLSRLVLLALGSAQALKLPVMPTRNFIATNAAFGGVCVAACVGASLVDVTALPAEAVDKIWQLNTLGVCMLPLFITSAANQLGSLKAQRAALSAGDAQARAQAVLALEAEEEQADLGWRSKVEGALSYDLAETFGCVLLPEDGGEPQWVCV